MGEAQGSMGAHKRGPNFDDALFCNNTLPTTKWMKTQMFYYLPNFCGLTGPSLAALTWVSHAVAVTMFLHSHVWYPTRKAD